MIEIKNVSKTYKRMQGLKVKKIEALKNVSFNIEKGKITALLGINGVGKSTVLKAIAGLIKIDSGEILIDGEKMNKNIYNKLAFVPDVESHFSNTTIKESFELMEIFYPRWNKEKSKEMMDIFKLNENEVIDNLSKGNIARVKLILGFCQDPDYILLDEPFTGIDLFKREEFIGVIAQYMKENQAIIITTHEIVEIESLVDEVIILDEGKIITSFNAEDLREREGKSILDKMREVYKNE
ncbi:MULTISPECIES: ABC transporter ATP-binding protein [unclassified Clostridioides]|uniref:ABC transporter ATP-binding protein n=1 Tax=unclassified Clostridioides TaxID=2635829 RepID=UPI001D1209BA|nr:ABC transporter ATP-binding protein [Clostridioides sp. ZZV14-6150]MCC0659375.1 ABC transporter ATP-binding protein [Clostridioides sp. ZZV14-6154]MCC0723311.1 ABC transporter ATP-binding protein [Clostridioides sp. ZZV14-6104]MCC0727319.1 ABC transporter ATP-binding protein [Clostridioides sp. ZZV14-6045]MCC0729574.1 ABC transporter ATP-binding protein [Clostridioides sp. ZZV14-6048]MCC0733676.1 ABC transporter ATP-binding protein [Clostridioides sp. ZZV14-6009]MCC0740459.1 ABC transporte